MKLVLEKGHQQSETSWIKQHAGGCVFLFFVLTVVCALLYATLSWMWDDNRLPLSKIILQGNLTYVTAQDVQSAFAKLDHIGTFMSQDVDELQACVQDIPWISHASIRKQWPDTIKVFLTEHQVQAIWNGRALIDTDGIVFDGDPGLVRGEYARLYGPENSGAEVLSMWRKYNPQFQKAGLSISSLVLNERRAWQVILDNGIRLELGKESVSERIERFFMLYQYLGHDVEKVSYIDLRYDTGAAVGWFPQQDLGQNSTNDKNDR